MYASRLSRLFPAALMVVTALNMLAVTPASATATAPSAPTNLTGVVGNGSVALSWSAPASDGGSPVTGYVVTANPGGATCATTSALQCTVSGLANGSSYSFSVTATNAMGTSAATGLANGTQSVLTPISVGNSPSGISSDGTHVWVANVNSNTVSEISVATGSLLASIPVGSAPHGISSDGTHVWVANYNDNTVSEIDISTGVVVATISVGSAPYAISSDGTYVWVTNAGSNTVSKIDATTATVMVLAIPVGGSPYGISSDGTHVWVANYGPDTVSEIDPTTATVIATTSVGCGGCAAIGVSSDGTHVWVANANANNVVEIDPMTAALTGLTIDGGHQPFGISYDGTHVWETSRNDYTVREIDAATGSIIHIFPVGNSPNGVSSDGTHVWVANFGGTTVSEVARTLTLPTVTATAPSAPTNLTGVAGNGSVALSWSAPTNDGGSPVTRYVVTANPGGATCATTSALQCTVSGLTNASSYSFSVTATNAVGTSAPDVTLSALTPFAPAPLRVIYVTASDQSLVAGTTPTSGATTSGLRAGDSAVLSALTFTYQGVSATHYGPSVTPPAAPGTYSVTPSNAHVTITPLSDQSLYSSTYIYLSGLLTISEVPSTPSAVSNVTATSGDGQAFVSWSTLANAADFTTVQYTLSASPGSAQCVTSGTSCLVTGLTNGVSYTFSVVARGTTPAGTSTLSAPSLPSPPVTPTLQALSTGRSGLQPGGGVVIEPSGARHDAPVHVALHYVSVAAQGISMVIRGGVLNRSGGVTSELLVLGQKLTFSGSGYLPGSMVNLFASSDGTLIGKAVVSSDGTYSTTVTPRMTLVTGRHTLESQGFAQSGTQLRLGLSVVLSKEEKSVTIGDFSVGSHLLSASTKAQLAQLSRVITSAGARSVVMTGLTDSPANVSLGRARAKTVETYLMASLRRLGNAKNIHVSIRTQAVSNPTVLSRLVVVVLG